MNIETLERLYNTERKSLLAQLEKANADLVIAKATPMQPLINGRFKENKIVSYCLENKTDMNDIAMQSFTDSDREQFAQLIGYSLGGYGDLSYVSDDSYDRAEEEPTTKAGE
jgi:hypothetical protein